jgi:hypothetical protein
LITGPSPSTTGRSRTVVDRDTRVVRDVVARDVVARVVADGVGVVVVGGATTGADVGGAVTAGTAGTAGTAATTGATGTSLVLAICTPAAAPTAIASTARAPTAHERISDTSGHRGPAPEGYRRAETIARSGHSGAPEV